MAGYYKELIYIKKNLKKFNQYLSTTNLNIYRKVAYVGHIGNMVRNDFDHKKKYQDLFFIKRNLG